MADWWPIIPFGIIMMLALVQTIRESREVTRKFEAKPHPEWTAGEVVVNRRGDRFVLKEAFFSPVDGEVVYWSAQDDWGNWRRIYHRVFPGDEWVDRPALWRKAD